MPAIADFQFVKEIPNIEFWVTNLDAVLVTTVKPSSLFDDPGQIVKHQSHFPECQFKPVGIFDGEQIVAFALNYIPYNLKSKYQIVKFNFNDPFGSIETADMYMYANFKKGDFLDDIVEIQDSNPISNILADYSARPYNVDPKSFVFNHKEQGVTLGKDGAVVGYEVTISHMLGGTFIQGVVRNQSLKIAMPLNKDGMVKIGENTEYGFKHAFDPNSLGNGIWNAITEETSNKHRG
jgi:hypothetical protein